MPTDLERWLERAREARFAPLSRIRTVAEEMRAAAGSARWAGLYARDVLVALEVFRLVNNGRDTHIACLEQAPVFMGEDRFFELGRRQPTVEDRLHGEAYEAYLGAVRRSMLRARLAKQWACEQGFQTPEEFYFSALFLGVGELIIRYLDPGLGRRTDVHLGPGRPWDGAEREVLGFTQMEFALVVAREFDLPQLLLEVPADDHCEVGKAALMRRIMDVADLAQDSAQGRVLQRRLGELSERWNRSAGRLAADIFACARDCARDAVEWYPVAGDHKLVEFHPRPYIWTRSEAMHGPPVEPRAAVPSADDMPRREAADAVRSPLKPRELIRQVVDRLSTEGRLKRSIVFAIEKDQGGVFPRYQAGVSEGSLLGRQAVELDGENLFSLMLKKPAALWVDASQRATLHSAIRGPLGGLLPAHEFFIASIFVKGRPLGLLFADGGESPRPLTMSGFESFKKALRYLCKGLEAQATSRTPIKRAE